MLPYGQTLTIQTGQAPEASYVETVESGGYLLFDLFILLCFMPVVGVDCTSQVYERICLLVHWLSGNRWLTVTDGVLAPLRSLVISLARLPALEIYARSPAVIFLNINAMGCNRSGVPILSSEDLRDEEVLNDYVARVLALGQFLCIVGI